MHKLKLFLSIDMQKASSEPAKPELGEIFLPLLLSRLHQKETRCVACGRSHSAVEGWSHAAEEESGLVRDQTLLVGETRTQFHLIVTKENLGPSYLGGFLPSYLYSDHQPKMLCFVKL